jgi:hypothetical protein
VKSIEPAQHPLRLENQRKLRPAGEAQERYGVIRRRAINALFWVGFVPLAGLLLLPWAIEAKGRALAD